MICRIEDLKKISTILLTAVDSSDISKITDNLELKVENEILNLSVTNGEYFVRTKLPIYENIDFHATVNANVFLKLLTKITTETVEFKIDNNNLLIIGNGEYKIPMIYDGTELMTLPEIKIDNVTNKFKIKSEILKSILFYNSKELSKRNVVSNPVQKLYYIDNEGAITFTSGACVNTFKLEKPVKILLSQKVVSLFKLFDDEDIDFSIGQDQIAGTSNIQTKVSFSSEFLSISAILPSNDVLIGTVPVKAIRDRAFNTYTSSVVLNRIETLQAIDRLMIFYGGSAMFYARFKFSSDGVKISTLDNEISESVNINSSSGLDNEYDAILDLNDLRIVLHSYDESHVTMNFGDNQAVVLIKPNIYSVIPEVRI